MVGFVFLEIGRVFSFLGRRFSLREEGSFVSSFSGIEM
jgi:hypothetical protein